MAGGSLFNSFEDEEFGGVQVPEIEEIEGMLHEQIDDEMVEAEQRINLAGYYQQLARGGIFKDNSDAARVVDAEVKAFARERMAVLLNLPSKPKTDLPFTEEQVAALQQWADKVIERNNSAGQPTIRAVSPPSAPKLPQAAQPKIPTITPLAPPAGSKQQPKKPQTQKRPATAPKKKAMTQEEYDQIPDLQIFEEAGKHYKFVTHPETGKRLKMKVSMTKETAGGAQHRIPMPTNAQMAFISESQAHSSLSSIPAAGNEKILIAAAKSIVDGQE